MTNGRLLAYTTSLHVFSVLSMCPAVLSPSGIWGTTTMSCESTTTTGGFVIDVSISILISIAIDISILVDIFIAIAISISVTIDIEPTIDIVVATDTGFHM